MLLSRVLHVDFSFCLDFRFAVRLSENSSRWTIFRPSIRQSESITRTGQEAVAVIVIVGRVSRWCIRRSIYKRSGVFVLPRHSCCRGSIFRFSNQCCSLTIDCLSSFASRPRPPWFDLLFSFGCPWAAENGNYSIFPSAWHWTNNNIGDKCADLEDLF